MAIRLMNQKQIEEFHNMIQYRQFETVPRCDVSVWNNKWDGKDFARIYCIHDFRDWISAHHDEPNP